MMSPEIVFLGFAIQIERKIQEVLITATVANCVEREKLA